MAELSLWLDYYDDIYSDFDSRHYVKRRISEDFLYELRNALKYKTGHTNDLVLLLPAEKRDEKNEPIIVNSLKDSFSNRFGVEKIALDNRLRKNIILLTIGIMVMIINSYISYVGSNSFTYIMLKILLEPAGWFLIWAGLDFLLYDFKTMKKECDFFRELSEMNVHFSSS